MKSLLLLICIIATLGLQVPAANIKRLVMTMSVCAGKDDVMVAMPGSCSGFFFCIGGNAIASSCGNYYHFNSRLGVCDHPDKALCQEETSIAEVATDAEATDVCAHAPDGHIFGKSYSCTLFYVCRQKHAVRRVCPPQKHFNVESKLCQDMDEAQCAFVTPSELVTVPTTHVSLASITVSSNTTSSSKPVPEKIPLQANYAKISFSPSSVCSGYKDKTTVPHPWDCGKFIYCLEHAPRVMECPQGLHFGSERMRCDLPPIANCKLNV